MKHTMLTAALLFGSLTAASAMAQAATQDAPPMQQHHMHRDPHHQAMHLSKKLGLSPDQTAKIEPILAQRHDQMEALRQNTSLTPDQRKAQMRDLNRNLHQQLAGVLTPDQMEQFKQMRKQHRHPQDGNQPAPAGV